MNYYIVASAFLVAVLFTLLFASLPAKRGPWRGIVIFFFIIFLASWAGQLWITPFGPAVGGVSLFPLLFVAVIFSLLIISVSPRAKAIAAKNMESIPEEESFLVIGMFFWFLILLLITAIVIGYYKIPPIVEGVPTS